MNDCFFVVVFFMDRTELKSGHGRMSALSQQRSRKNECREKDSNSLKQNTAKPQWLEHVLHHGNLSETWVVRATEGIHGAR